MMLKDLTCLLSSFLKICDAKEAARVRKGRPCSKHMLPNFLLQFVLEANGLFCALPSLLGKKCEKHVNSRFDKNGLVDNEIDVQ